jgi:transposase-like protein
MALADLSMLEQRYLAVREVLDTGATVTDVAARHGVDRRTLHRWLVRYANDGSGPWARRRYRDPAHWRSRPEECGEPSPCRVLELSQYGWAAVDST